MMTIFNLEDQEAYYESDEAYLVISMKDDNIKDILGLFEKKKDARQFTVEFGNNNKSIRVMPIPFLRGKK